VGTLLSRSWRAADLSCGVCLTCIEKNECERAYLHKFRSTYGTTMLRKYDISTVRKLMELFSITLTFA
jgi:hypothetical protein